MESNIIKLYNPSLSFKDNFSVDKDDKHLVFRISKNSNFIGLIPDNSSVILTDLSKIRDQMYLRSIIMDYYSLFGLRYNMFKRYDPNFFECDERIFFEALLINYKKADFRKFEWAKSKIFYELGIKRTRLETIIRKFKRLGIINNTVVHSLKMKPGSRKNKASFFVLNPEVIIGLIPSIYFRFEMASAKEALIRFLTPAIKN